MALTGRKQAIDSIINKMPVKPQPNYAYKNNGDITFDNANKEWGFETPSLSNGVAYGDLDNDGDLDAIVGGHEYGNMFTGIFWNDGQGNFITSDTTPLNQYRDKWGTIPELSASDLDNDGDMEIVYSRTGKSYEGGAAIQIIENLGNKKFKDYGVIPLASADGWIDGIRFRDLDKDGDIDLYLSSFVSLKTNGMVLLNEGSFDFKVVVPDDAKKYVAINFKALIPLSEEQKAEEQAIDDEIAAFAAELAAELGE